MLLLLIYTADGKHCLW